jgi:hypothetical protein
VQKSSALSVLPFAMNADVSTELQNFKQGACNWVEMTVANEVVNLVGVRMVSVGESLQPFIDPENARYEMLVLEVLVVGPPAKHIIALHHTFEAVFTHSLLLLSQRVRSSLVCTLNHSFYLAAS